MEKKYSKKSRNMIKYRVICKKNWVGLFQSMWSTLVSLEIKVNAQLKLLLNRLLHFAQILFVIYSTEEIKRCFTQCCVQLQAILLMKIMF